MQRLANKVRNATTSRPSVSMMLSAACGNSTAERSILRVSIKRCNTNFTLEGHAESGGPCATRRGGLASILSASLTVMLSVLLPGLAKALPPANDQCSSATVISSPFTQTLDITDATTDPSDPPLCPLGTQVHSNSVWYSFTAPDHGEVTVDTNGTDFNEGFSTPAVNDTVLALFTGSCGALTLLRCDDESGAGYRSKFTFPVSRGQTYLIEAVRFEYSPSSPPLMLQFNLAFESPCTGAADGATCDDNDPCTASGSCNAGYCNDGMPIDPCVVAGDYQVFGNAVMDMGGKSLQLAEGASLIGEPGGSITIQNSSGFTIAKGASVKNLGKASATSSITVMSDGPCDIQGKINAGGEDGAGGSFEARPGPGGTITLECNGLTLGKKAAILAVAKGAKVNGEAQGAEGGMVSLSAGNGAFSSVKGSKIDVRGKLDSGGSVSVGSSTDCSVDGSVKTTATSTAFEEFTIGGEGGSVIVDCNGRVTIGEHAKLLVGGVKTAAGGTVGLTSGQSLTISPGAKIQNYGIEGTLTAESPDQCLVGGKLVANAANGKAGTFDFTCGSFTLGADAKLEGIAAGDEAGVFQVLATEDCEVAGAVSLKATALSIEGVKVSGIGGTASLNCGTGARVTAGGAIDASGTGGTPDDFSVGGMIGIEASGAVAIDGKLGVNAAGPGGVIDLQGCDVTIGVSGKLNADGESGGSNTLTAHHQLIVNGRVSAVNTDDSGDLGVNSLIYRDSVSIADSAVVLPASSPAQNGSLSPCP